MVITICFFLLLFVGFSFATYYFCRIIVKFGKTCMTLLPYMSYNISGCLAVSMAIYCLVFLGSLVLFRERFIYVKTASH